MRSIRKISGQQRNKKIYDLVELKWKSVKTRDVFIPLQEYRYLDAFQVIHASPNTVQLSINQFLIDFSGYQDKYTLEGPNTFQLEYIIYSSNFAPARDIFTLSIGRKLNDIKFYKKKMRVDLLDV